MLWLEGEPTGEESSTNSDGTISAMLIRSKSASTKYSPTVKPTLSAEGRQTTNEDKSR